MNNHYVVITLVLVIISGIISACQAQDNDNTNNILNEHTESNQSETIREATLPFNVPDEYLDTQGRVSFNITEIVCPSNCVLFNGVAREIGFDYEGLASDLLSGIDYVYDADMNSYLSADPSISEQCVLSNRFAYVSSEKMKMLDIYYFPIIDEVSSGEADSWLDFYKEEKEFDFGSAENCFQNTTTILQQYGLNLNDYDFDIDIYYLDHELVQNENNDFTSDDDYYIFCLNQVCQGLRDFHHIQGDYWNGIINPEECTIRIGYGKTGIISIDSNRCIYDYDLSDVCFDLISFEDMIQIVSNWCNDSIDDGTTFEVTRAELFMDYERNSFMPVWNYIILIRGENSESMIDVNFDATSGNYISMN